jgi:hypothetical protein
MSARPLALIVLAALLAQSAPVAAAGKPVFFSPGDLNGPLAKRVLTALASRRTLRDEPLPTAIAAPTGIDPRVEPIVLALARAKKAESEASWDDCVREAASALGSAVDLLAATGQLDVLRDLHVQIGACLSLAGSPDAAKSHFQDATLLDESKPPVGVHRSDAEKAQEEARNAVLARAHGELSVTTDPPGAEVWIDGKRAPGVTPLNVDVRLGDHFVTVRRFRFEGRTERRSLIPGVALAITLDPAHRTTLGEQLAVTLNPPADELLFARAIWSRADDALFAARAGEGATLRLYDASTGHLVRTSRVPAEASDALVRKAVCDALGETCEAEPRGVPWYVWPLAGAVVVGSAIAIGFAVQSNRDLRLCPAAGCR